MYYLYMYRLDGESLSLCLRVRTHAHARARARTHVRVNKHMHDTMLTTTFFFEIIVQHSTKTLQNTTLHNFTALYTTLQRLSKLFKIVQHKKNSTQLHTFPKTLQLSQKYTRIQHSTTLFTKHHTIT